MSGDEGEYKLCFTAKGGAKGGRVKEVDGHQGLAWQHGKRGEGASSAGVQAATAAARMPTRCERLAPLSQRAAARPSLLPAMPGTPGRPATTHSLLPSARPCGAAADYHTAQGTRIKMKWATGAEAHDWEAVAKKDNLNAIQVRQRRCFAGWLCKAGRRGWHGLLLTCFIGELAAFHQTRSQRAGCKG